MSPFLYLSLRYILHTLYLPYTVYAPSTTLWLSIYFYINFLYLIETRLDRNHGDRLKSRGENPWPLQFKQPFRDKNGEEEVVARGKGMTWHEMKWKSKRRNEAGIFLLDITFWNGAEASYTVHPGISLLISLCTYANVVLFTKGRRDSIESVIKFFHKFFSPVY